MVASCLVECPGSYGALTAATVPTLLPAEVAWSRPLDHPAATTATADDTHVYIPLTSGQIVALSRVSGEQIWTSNLKTNWPLVAEEESLYAVSDTSLVDLDPATGSVRRRHALPGEPTGPLTRVGELLLIPVQPSWLVAWHLRESKEIWRQTFEAPVTVAPVVSNSRETIIVASKDRLSAAALSDGVRQWTTVLEGTLTQPVVVGDLVIVGSTSDDVFALDSRGRLRWPWSGWSDIVGITADADNVYVASLDNIVRAFKLKDGSRQWRKVVATRLVFPPQLAASTLLISGIEPALTALSVRGDQVGTYALPELAYLAVAPLVLEPQDPESVTLVLLARDGEVFGLRRARPKEEASPPASPKTAAPAL
jgi:hypothetical protein